MDASKEPVGATRADVEAAGEKLGRAGAVEIDAFVESGRLDLMFEALDRQLDSPPDERTYDTLEKVIVPLVGFDGLAVISWLASLSGRALPDELEGLGLSSTSKDGVRRLLARYGPQISDAAYRSPVAPFQGDEWRTVQRDVLLDVETGVYTVVARIVKRNGEVVTLRSSASSMLRLVRVLLRILRKVDDRAAFEPEDVEAFMGTTEDFRSFVTGEAPSSRESEGE